MLGADGPKAAAAKARPIGRLPPAVRLAMSAALVGAFCYLGNLFDATVRFPSIGTAVFYPPYAVVTAALLLSPTRHWWVFLLASSLAHLLVHRFDRPTWHEPSSRPAECDGSALVPSGSTGSVG